VRPEHLDLAGDDAGVGAKVIVVEPTGADTQVFADLAGTQISAVFSERHAFKPDQTIRLQPRLESVHLFDAASGRHL
jgi:multiple sugar transport system ATP-binding protein